MTLISTAVAGNNHERVLYARRTHNPHSPRMTVIYRDPACTIQAAIIYPWQPQPPGNQKSYRLDGVFHRLVWVK